MCISLLNRILSNWSKRSRFNIWVVQLPPSNTYHSVGCTGSINPCLLIWWIWILSWLRVALLSKLSWSQDTENTAELQGSIMWPPASKSGRKCPVLIAVTLVQAGRKTEAACSLGDNKHSVQRPVPSSSIHSEKGPLEGLLFSGRSLLIPTEEGGEWFCSVLFVFPVKKSLEAAEWGSVIQLPFLSNAKKGFAPGLAESETWRPGNDAFFFFCLPSTG